MSLSLDFDKQQPKLNRLKLPTRYYHFTENGNYIKLLSIGEGNFPKDKISLKLKLNKSECVVSTESATKVYPSNKEYGINRFDLTLQNHSNLECINDELILFKKAKYLQLFTLKSDASSHFFYVDILSNGRSYEHFDFTQMQTRNRFYIEGELEYLENYTIEGAFLKDYYKRHNTKEYLYAKVYIKALDNDALESTFRSMGFQTFAHTHTQKMLIGVLNASHMGNLKKMLNTLWNTYRAQNGMPNFNLGKQ